MQRVLSPALKLVVLWGIRFTRLEYIAAAQFRPGESHDQEPLAEIHAEPDPASVSQEDGDPDVSLLFILKQLLDCPI
jgi:hypothetical protein